MIFTAATATSCKSSKDAATDTATTISNTQTTNDAVNRTLIIYYDETTGSTPLLNAAKEYGAEIIYQYQNLKGIALRIPEGKNVAEAIKHFKAVEGVTSVTRDRKQRLHQ